MPLAFLAYAAFAFSDASVRLRAGNPDVLAEYDEVTAFSAPGAYDPAWILGAAADLLVEDPDALDTPGAVIRIRTLEVSQ